MNKLLLILFLTGSLYSASFDCTKASTTIEKAICKSNTVSKIDEKLSMTFNTIRKSLNTKESKKFIEAQKLWLKKRDTEFAQKINDTEKENFLYSFYENRLDELKEYYASRIFKFPSGKELNQICNSIATQPITFTELNQILINDFDVNNDGINEHVICTTQGTAHVPICKYMLEDNTTIDIDQIGFEWKDYWTYNQKFLQIKEKVYKLNFKDDGIKEPSFLSIITPENEEEVVCEFETKELEELVPNDYIENSNEICKALENQDKTKYSYINTNKKVTHNISELNRFKKSSSYPKSQGKIDFDNDLNDEMLVEIDYASGAGRGCDFHYYDEINETNFTNSYKRNLLLGMQSVSIDSYHPNCGVVNTKFFKYKDIIYYDYHTKSNHNIYLIQDKKIHTVCVGKKRNKLSVTYVRE